MKKRKKIGLNNSGVVLTTVMIMLLVMSILISGVVFITVSNLNNSNKTSDNIENYYVAEGGINFLVKRLETEFNLAKTTYEYEQANFFKWLNDFAAEYPEASKTTNAIAFSDNNGKISKAEIWMSAPVPNEAGTLYTYQLHSTGWIGNLERTLTKNIQISYVSGGAVFNNAFLASTTNEKLVLVGVDIKGAVQTTSTSSGAITFGSKSSAYMVRIPLNVPKTYVEVKDKTINDHVISEDGTIIGLAGIYNVKAPTLNPISFETAPLDSGLVYLNTKSYSGNALINSTTRNFAIDYTNVSSLANQTYNLTTENSGSMFRVDSFVVSAKADNFTIQVDRDVTIVTRTLQLNNRLVVKGKGKLTIFVRPSDSPTSSNSNFQMGSDYELGHLDDPKLFRIYAGKQTYMDSKTGKTNVMVNFTNKVQSPPTFLLSIVAQELNFTLNNVSVRGVLATTGTDVYFDGGSSASAMLLYAPNATVHGQSSASSFFGAIVAKYYDNVAGKSGPVIEYDSEVNNYIPYDVIDISGIIGPPMISFTKSATQE